MIPDVLGYRLDDALSLLENSGFEVTLVVTKPARGNPDGVKRVVKLEIAKKDSVVITVACEEKGKGGVHNGL